MILKQLFKDKKPKKVVKNPIIKDEAYKYLNGQSKPLGQNTYELWLKQIGILRTAVQTTAELASGADIKFYREDTKGNKKVYIPKMLDKYFMNDKDEIGSFLYNYFGQIKLYDNCLIIPEMSSYKPRTGLVDFFIIDNQRWEVNPNTTGKQTIESITYKSTQGIESNYKYEDIIYISKPLTSNNLLYGLSRLQALNEEITRILNMGTYVDNYIASGGKKAVIIGTDDFMSPNQEDDIQEAFDTFFKDPNKKSLMLNTEKLSVKEVSESLASLDVVNFMVKLNKRVLESYNLPKFLLGDFSETSNAELVKLSLRIFFEVAIKPEFLRLQRHLTRYARDVLNIKNLIIEFDYAGISILEDSATDVLSITSEQLKVGGISINEFRVKNGYEAIDNPNFDLNFAPAYLAGSNPVTIQNLQEDIARNINNTNTNTTNQVPSGEGGANNTPNENGSS